MIQLTEKQEQALVIIHEAMQEFDTALFSYHTTTYNNPAFKTLGQEFKGDRIAIVGLSVVTHEHLVKTT